jgi:hypothetical protein
MSQAPCCFVSGDRQSPAIGHDYGATAHFSVDRHRVDKIFPPQRLAITLIKCSKAEELSKYYHYFISISE